VPEIFILLKINAHTMLFFTVPAVIGNGQKAAFLQGSLLSTNQYFDELLADNNSKNKKMSEFGKRK
jgi:hypothetical protein